MRSRTSEPGSISQKRARSKSGPSAGTATLNRVTATVPLKSPIVRKTSCERGRKGRRGEILADGGRGRRLPRKRLCSSPVLGGGRGGGGRGAPGEGVFSPPRGGGGEGGGPQPPDKEASRTPECPLLASPEYR